MTGIRQFPDVADVAVAADLDVATATSALDVLAHWWSRPLPEEMETWQANGEIARAVGDRMGTPDLPAWDARDAVDLLDEYERLFVGPGPVPCPPYESYWRSDVPIDLRNGLMGPCTEELRRLYAQLGLEVRASTGELPDYLPIELEALAYALGTLESREVTRALFSDHVATWLPWFGQGVEREAEHPFYRDLARMTRTWSAGLERYLASTVAPTVQDTGGG